jgi:hypothetical protein
VLFLTEPYLPVPCLIESPPVSYLAEYNLNVPFLAQSYLPVPSFTESYLPVPVPSSVLSACALPN